MVLRQPPPDALVSFSEFLLDRFGLAATMQVALLGSIAFHAVVVLGIGLNIAGGMRFDDPHNVMDVVLVNAKSATKPQKADALAQANLDGGGNTDQKLRAASPFPGMEAREPAPELRATESRRKQLEEQGLVELADTSSLGHSG